MNAPRQYIRARNYTAADNPPTNPRPTFADCLSCEHPTLYTAYGIDGE